MDKFEKWNKYNVNKIHFVENTRDHLARLDFIDYVINGKFKNIVEIGGGVLLEYEKIKDRKEISYTMVDVSTLFLNNCKNKYPEVATIKQSIEEFSSPVDYDLVYVANVLEHSYNVRASIKNIITCAKNFYITMFRWGKGNNLKSKYHGKRQYWSSTFGIDGIFSVIEKYGTITSKRITLPGSNEIKGFDKYFKNWEGKSHRNGNWLIIQGTRK